jgi:hypothetical protein
LQQKDPSRRAKLNIEKLFCFVLVVVAAAVVAVAAVVVVERQ